MGFIYFLIGAALGGGSVWIYMTSKEDSFDDINEERKKEKERRKKEIYQFFQDQEKVTNNQIQRILDISDTAATMYLDELEMEGKIEQVGESQRDTYYKLK